MEHYQDQNQTYNTCVQTQIHIIMLQDSLAGQTSRLRYTVTIWPVAVLEPCKCHGCVLEVCQVAHTLEERRLHMHITLTA